MSVRSVLAGELFDDLRIATIRAVKAEEKLAAVRSLHVPDPRELGRCVSCSTRMPCATAKAVRP